MPLWPKLLMEELPLLAEVILPPVVPNGALKTRLVMYQLEAEHLLNFWKAKSYLALQHCQMPKSHTQSNVFIYEVKYQVRVKPVFLIFSVKKHRNILPKKKLYF